MRARFGGFGAEPLADSATNASSTSIVAIGLKRRSNPIVVELRELIALPQSEPATCPGNTSTPSGSSSSRRSEWKRASGARRRLDGEVGSGRVADEERVAREHEPRLVRTCRVDHGETAVLGPVSRRVDRPDPDGSHLELGSIRERVVRIVDLRSGVDAHRHVVLEREAAVPGDVIGVRVGLERAHDSHVEPLGLPQDGLDRERRIDDDRLTGLLAADEVRGTAEVVVDELREQHGAGR